MTSAPESPGRKPSKGTVVAVVELVDEDDDEDDDEDGDGEPRCTLRALDSRAEAWSVPPLEHPPSAMATSTPPTRTLPRDAFN